MDEMVIAQRDRESFFDLAGAGVGRFLPECNSDERVDSSLMHFYRLLAVFGIFHGPTEFGDLLPERIT